MTGNYIYRYVPRLPHLILVILWRRLSVIRKSSSRMLWKKVTNRHPSQVIHDFNLLIHKFLDANSLKYGILHTFIVVCNILVYHLLILCSQRKYSHSYQRMRWRNWSKKRKERWRRCPAPSYRGHQRTTADTAHIPMRNLTRTDTGEHLFST